jgi:hypothetical protein
LMVIMSHLKPKEGKKKKKKSKSRKSNPNFDRRCSAPYYLPRLTPLGLASNLMKGTCVSAVLVLATLGEPKILTHLCIFSQFGPLEHLTTLSCNIKHTIISTSLHKVVHLYIVSHNLHNPNIVTHFTFTECFESNLHLHLQRCLHLPACGDHGHHGSGCHAPHSHALSWAVLSRHCKTLVLKEGFLELCHPRPYH